MSHFVGHVFVPPHIQNDEIDSYLEEVLEEFSEHRQVEPYLDETIHAERLDEMKERVGESLETDPHKSEDETLIEYWYGHDDYKKVGPRSFEIYSTLNPNSEWDWWVIGGRWQNFFGPSLGDIIKVEGIDWDAERDEVSKDAQEQYDEFEKETEGLTLHHTWRELYEEYGDDRRHEAREIYNSQEWVRAAKTCIQDFIFATPEDYFKVNAGGREAFITDKIAGVGVPYAFIDLEGEWHSRGQMGWFGMSSDDDEPFDWAAKYFGYVEQVSAENPEALVVSVDFHI